MRDIALGLLLAALIVLLLLLYLEIEPDIFQDAQTETNTVITIENTTNSHNTYKINISESCLSNNSVGEDWYITYRINGKIIDDGEKFSVPFDLEKVDFLTEIVESDEFSDSNSKKITIDLSDTEPITTQITVTENGGPYEGNTATWEITVSVERLI